MAGLVSAVVLLSDHACRCIASVLVAGMEQCGSFGAMGRESSMGRAASMETGIVDGLSIVKGASIVAGQTLGRH